MRKILIILLSGTLLFSCNEAEETTKTESGYDTFYNLHQNDEGVLTIGMPVFMFKLFVSGENKEVKEAVDNIETIDLFIKEKSNEEYFKGVYKHFPSKTYKTLFTANNNESDLKFFVKERKEKVDELVGIVNDKKDNNCVVLRIGGDFNFEDIEKLAEKIDISEIAKYR